MKNFKKLISLISVGSLLLSSMVVSAETISGSGIVEYDNALVPEHMTVVVSTINPATFNMTLDPESLLNVYQPTSYPTAKTVYFSNTTFPQAKNTTKLYKKTYAETTAGSNAEAAIKANIEATGSKGSYTWAIKSSSPATYYVWGPDENGKGHLIELTNEIIPTYFDIELDQSAASTSDAVSGGTVTQIDTKSAGHACDGKLYKFDKYVELTDGNGDNIYDSIADYVTYNSEGAIASVTDLYKEGASFSATDESKGEAVTVDDIDATALNIIHSEKTDDFTVVNKTKDGVTVTVEAYPKNTTGLVIFDNTTFQVSGKTSDDIGLYVALQDGSGTDQAKIVGDSILYSQQIAGSTTEKYQSGINEQTGGHNYSIYNSFAPSYGTATFKLTANANKTGTNTQAWKNYASKVTSSTRPSFNIVYTFEKTAEVPTLTFASFTTSLKSPSSVKGTIASYGNQTELVDVGIDVGGTIYSENGSKFSGKSSILASGLAKIDNTKKEVSIEGSFLKSNSVPAGVYRIYFLYDGGKIVTKKFSLTE